MRIPNSGGGYIKRCPACGTPIKVRSSEQISMVTSEYIGSCQRTGCGAQVKGLFSWVAYVSPTGLAKPLVDLPLTPVAERNKRWREHGADGEQLDLIDQLESEEQ